MTSPRCILHGHEPGQWAKGAGVYDDRTFLLCAHCGHVLEEKPNGLALQPKVHPDEPRAP